ncbi:Hydroxypyruvate reductase [subsurface metagenome]
MNEGKKFKIVITEYNFKDAEIEKKTLEGLDCEIIETHSDDEEVIIRECADADALIVQFAPITEKVINSLNKCKVISRYGIGVDTMDLNAAKSKGILVCNVPDYCLEEVAEHCLALILSIGRKIVHLSPYLLKNLLVS